MIYRAFLCIHILVNDMTVSWYNMFNSTAFLEWLSPMITEIFCFVDRPLSWQLILLLAFPSFLVRLWTTYSIAIQFFHTEKKTFIKFVIFIEKNLCDINIVVMPELFKKILQRVGWKSSFLHFVVGFFGSIIRIRKHLKIFF